MSFPYHDTNWTEAADFLTARHQPQTSILAPDLFWWRFPMIYRYVNPWSDEERRYDWVIIHKGEMEQLPRRFLDAMIEEMLPVFANPVFVTFARTEDLPAVAAASDDLISFFERLAAVAPDAPTPVLPLLDDHVLPDRGRLVKFETLDDDAFRDAMNGYWRNGGYLYQTLRDRVYYREFDRQIVTRLGDFKGERVLDLCCGIGRLAAIASSDCEVIGVDVADVAIEKAEIAHRHRPHFSFRVMDAHRLDFPDASFDSVLLIDALEHLKDPKRVIEEVVRVLKPGGRFLVDCANKNSLNQIVTRKLGYPDFVTNFQHIHEFSFSELGTILHEKGLDIVETAGIFLYPYWGVPGIDSLLRPILDDDPEMVELTRVLGERAGAEYAYVSVFLTRKPMEAEQRDQK